MSTKKYLKGMWLTRIFYVAAFIVSAAGLLIILGMEASAYGIDKSASLIEATLGYKYISLLFVFMSMPWIIFLITLISHYMPLIARFHFCRSCWRHVAVEKKLLELIKHCAVVSAVAFLLMVTHGLQTDMLPLRLLLTRVMDPIYGYTFLWFFGITSLAFFVLNILALLIERLSFFIHSSKNNGGKDA